MERSSTPLDGCDAAQSVGRSRNRDQMTPLSQAASLQGGRDEGMGDSDPTGNARSGANNAHGSPKRRGPKEMPLVDSWPLGSTKETARSPSNQKQPKFQSRAMLEEVSPRKPGAFPNISPGHSGGSSRKQSEERDEPSSGRMTPPTSTQPIERSSSNSQSSPMIFRSILKKTVMTSRAPPFAGNAEDNDDDGGEVRLTAIGRVASADFVSPGTRRVSRTDDGLGLTARKGKKEDHDEEGDAIYYYSHSDHHDSSAVRESFTDLDLDTSPRHWDDNDADVRRPRRLHQRATTDTALFSDTMGVVGSYRTAGGVAGAIRIPGSSDHRGASFRAQQRTLHANLAQQWYLKNYDRWSSTSRQMAAESHVEGELRRPESEKLSWSGHDRRLDTASAGFEDAGIVISNIDTVGSPEPLGKSVTVAALARDRVASNPHSDSRRQRSLSVNDRPSSASFVADATLPMEIMEGTPAAEALRANADVRVTKIDKLARKLNMQTVPRVIKNVVVAPAKAVVGAERGKPPRVPSARPFDAHDDVKPEKNDDDGDRTHDLESLDEEEGEEEDDDEEEGRAPHHTNLTTLEEGTERDEATLEQSPSADEALAPPRTDLQRFVSDVTVPESLRPVDDLLHGEKPIPQLRPESPMRNSWNPGTPGEDDAPDIAASPRTSPIAPPPRPFARFSYRDIEEGLTDRHGGVPFLSIETPENQGKRRSASSPGIFVDKGRGGGAVKVVDDAKASPMRRRLTGDFRPFHERRWKARSRLRKNKSSRKSYVKGKVIDGEHELYTLSIAVMLGLRTSIGVTNSELMNPANRKKWLELEDFMAVEKYVFKPKGGPKTPPHQLSHTFKFKDYSPVAFAYIRRMFGVNEYEFLLSVCGNANFIEFISNAKSGQFFFYSSDGKYMIKTMTNAESKFLRRILPHYFRHCTRNPSTLITKFLGMYRVKMYHLKRNVKFVIMNSVFDTDKVLSSFFDLKGSTLGREAKPGETVKKDNDVRHGMPQTCFALRRDVRERMRAQVVADCNFLTEMKILDYSMLIGVHQMPPKKGRPMKQPLFASDRKLSHRVLDIPNDKPSSAPSVFDRQTSRNCEEERGPERDVAGRGINQRPSSDGRMDANIDARASLSTGEDDATLESLNVTEKSNVVRFGELREDKTDNQSVDSFATLDQFFDDDDDFSYLDGSGRPGGRGAHPQDGDFADIENIAGEKQGEMDEIQKRMEETVEHMYWPYHRLYDIYGRRRMKEMPLPKQQPSKGRKRMGKKWKIPEFEAPISNRKDGGLMMDTSFEDSPEMGSSRRQELELIDGKIFYMGIIDILQVYNVRKRLEARLRRLQGAGWEGASCVPPTLYGDRFVRFFDEYSQRVSPYSYQPLGSEDDNDVRGDENLGEKVEI